MLKLHRVALGLVFPVLVAGFAIWRAAGLYNRCIEQEAALVAAVKASELEYDNLWKKVSETASVADRYGDDFKEALHGAIGLRQPPADIKSLHQFLREANPALPDRTYAEVQRILDSGRDRYTASQRAVTELQQAYQVSLAAFPDVLLAGALGFPREVAGHGPADLDGDGKRTVLDYPVVTSARTETAFASGREDAPIDVFGDR